MDFGVAVEGLDVVELGGVVHHVDGCEADHSAERCFAFADFELFVKFFAGDGFHCGEDGFSRFLELGDSGFFVAVGVGADSPTVTEGPWAGIFATELGSDAVVDDDDFVGEIVARTGFAAG